MNLQEDPQTLELSRPGCLRGHSTAVHEFMHALGFHHEQNRPDRDQYVIIHEEIIKPKKEHNFKKAKRSDTLGQPYDYYSIMHYKKDAFSKNGKMTIEPKQPGASISYSLL